MCAAVRIDERFSCCRQAWLWLGKLFFIGGVLWATLFGVLHWVQPVSRRACNMSYVVLSLSLNWMMLVLFIGGSMLSMSRAPLNLLAACSSNMLLLFLASNVLTGGVNIMVNSLLIPDWQAIGIVSVYMCLVCCIALILHSSRVQLRLGLVVSKTH